MNDWFDACVASRSSFVVALFVAAGVGWCLGFWLTSALLSLLVAL